MCKWPICMTKTKGQRKGREKGSMGREWEGVRGSSRVRDAEEGRRRREKRFGWPPKGMASRERAATRRVLRCVRPRDHAISQECGRWSFFVPRSPNRTKRERPHTQTNGHTSRGGEGVWNLPERFLRLTKDLWSADTDKDRKPWTLKSNRLRKTSTLVCATKKL